MIQFKQFIVESNFNKLPSYLAAQIKKIITDFIDRGCTSTRYAPIKHLSLIGYISINHLGPDILKIPVVFSKHLSNNNGQMVYNPVSGHISIEISMDQFKNIKENSKRSILMLYRLLVHETSHVIDEFLNKFKNKKQQSKYNKAIRKLNQIEYQRDTDPGSVTKDTAAEDSAAYKNYIMSPVEVSAISSEIYHSIQEHYSLIKTKTAKQLFLKQLEVFIKSNFNTYFKEKAELKLPPFLRKNSAVIEFFKYLHEDRKQWHKFKLKLLNLYNNLLVHYHIT